MQQLLAASQAQRELHYHSFEDQSIADDIMKLSNQFVSKKMTVGSLYKQEAKLLK